MAHASPPDRDIHFFGPTALGTVQRSRYGYNAISAETKKHNQRIGRTRHLTMNSRHAHISRFPARPYSVRLGSKLVLTLAMGLILSGCQSILRQTYQPSLNPSNSPQIVSEVQKSDPNASLGAREHPRILENFGGEYSDRKTELLVARITGALTAVSENPNQSYRITILDSPAVNAFALPGGFLYVTRGLLALANDEAEVAAVLSHEMAHVTANHGIERQKREEAELIAGEVVAEIVSNDLAGKQAIARGKLRLAAFSRTQELQADVIGVRMLGEAGYDPYAAARFLESMAGYGRYNAVDAGQGAGLDFLSSHPSAPQRVELARRHARAFGAEGTGDARRDAYLNGIDGLLYGDSPSEGFVRGRAFVHPLLEIRFEAPPGFQIDNTADAVLATGPGDLAVRFDGVDRATNRSLTQYISSGWVSGLINSTVRAIKINGFDAATARAASGEWDFDVTVIRVDRRIYRFLTAAPKGSPDLKRNANFVKNSFRKLTASEIRSTKPLRIRVVTVAPGQSIASLAGRMKGTDRKLELFRLINSLPPGASLRPGTRVKIVSE